MARPSLAIGVLVAMLVALLAALPAAAATDRIDVTRAMLEPTGDGSAWLLSAQFDVDLTERLDVAVERGVALPFVLEFLLVRPRWYWRNERIAQAERHYRLSYSALTRQYALRRDGLTRNFETLGEALSALARVQGWRVLENRWLEPGQTYRASLRLRLDLGALPQAMQADAITNRDWNPRSEWSSFPFTPRMPSSTQ